MKKVLIVVVLILIGGAVYYWVMPQIYIKYFKKPVPQQQDKEQVLRNTIAEAKYQLQELQNALKSFYTENETYPENLFNLTTPVAYIARIPADPFSPFEAEFNYKKLGDTDFLLWGIGPDGKNDEGQIIFDPTNGITSSGDIVRTPASK